MDFKYIRFFISSTFADMNRERNLLNEVLKQLKHKYASEGWVIEWTDLRWGISRESSLENKTMTVCLDELRRCQKWSPRPNFIVLMGERYGWIPLPELIPAGNIDMKKLSRCSKLDRKLFEQWYRFDANCLPAGQYVLQPRTGGFANDFTYESLVIKPLKQILSQIAVGSTSETLEMSATVQEIMNGINEAVAKDTFVYLRELTDIPNDALSTYRESDSRAIRRLREVRAFIDSIIDKKNRMEIKGNFSDYDSGEMNEAISEGMFSHLDKLIDRVVTERTRTMAKSENEYHLNLTQSLKGMVVGRDAELARLENYVYSSADHALLLKADSGIGKSAVMAELANRISTRGDRTLVVRFCDKTAESSSAWELMDSILGDLYKFTEAYRKSVAKGRKPFPPHIKRGDGGLGDFMLTPVEDLLKYKLLQPVVLLIDALDVVDDTLCQQFFDLEWLKIKLPPMLKVIVSCTPEPIKNKNLGDIQVIELDGLRNKSMTMVRHLLALKGRTLTPSQDKDIERVVMKSDTSGIYLKVLTELLATLPSWAETKLIPSDFDGLLDLILDKLRKPEQHGTRMVDSTLRWIASTRMGLSDIEIRDLLSEDAVISASVESQSMHRTMPGMPKVPPIFWTRLQTDMSPLLKRHYTNIGVMNIFSHRRIEAYVKRRLMADDATVFSSYAAVYNLLSSKLPAHDRHALYECCKLIKKVVSISSKLRDQNHETWDKALQSSIKAIDYLLIKSPLYVLFKAVIFRNDLIQDLFMAQTLFADPVRGERYAKMRRDLIELPKGDDMESIVYNAMNLNDDSMLANLAREYLKERKVLIDRWRNLKKRKSTVDSIGSIGILPQISIAGDKVASLTNDNTILSVRGLTKDTIHESCDITITGKPLSISSDFRLKRHVITTAEGIYLISEVGDKLWWDMPGAKGYISDDGNKVIIATKKDIITYDCNTQNFIDFTTDVDIEESMPSDSGEFVWWTGSDGTTHRINVPENKNLSFGPSGKLLCVDNEICVVGNCNDDKLFEVRIYKHHICNGKDNYLTITCILGLESNPTVWYDSCTDSVFIRSYTSLEEVRLSSAYEMIHHDRIPEIESIRGKYALQTSPLAIVEWKQLLNEPYASDMFNNGIGSFSASYDGNVAAMTFGVNPFSESYNRIIIVENEEMKLLSLPFMDRNFILITSVAVSPDGKYIGASSNIGEIILVDRSDMSLIANFKTKEHTGCLGISFSDDSRYMIAVQDHFISNPKPVIHIGDVDRREIYEAAGQLDWCSEKNAPWMPWPQGFNKLFGRGRYAVLGDFIWDLKLKRSILPLDKSLKHKIIDLRMGDRSKVSQPPLRGIFEDKKTGLIWAASDGVLTIIDPEIRKIEEIPFNEDLIGVSCDSSYWFTVNSQKQLTAWHNSEGDRPHIVAHGITAVFPAIDNPTALYAYSENGYVLYLDIFGKEYGRAYVPNLWHAIPTRRGLAGATIRGPILLTLASFK